MAEFPKSQSETIVLAQKMIAGLTANPLIYPAPPETPPELTLLLNAALAARDAAMASAAATEQLFAVFDQDFEALIEAMKSDLRYAENTVGNDDAKLNLIGWGGRRDPSNTPPNQPRTLEVVEQGDDWVSLDWKNPFGGARVAAYTVERRERPAGDWAEVGTALNSEDVLTGQPKAKELEYRVLAINGAGASPPSNTVMVVL